MILLKLFFFLKKGKEIFKIGYYGLKYSKIKVFGLVERFFVIMVIWREDWGVGFIFIVDLELDFCVNNFN